MAWKALSCVRDCVKTEIMCAWLSENRKSNQFAWLRENEENVFVIAWSDTPLGGSCYDACPSYKEHRETICRIRASSHLPSHPIFTFLPCDPVDMENFTGDLFLELLTEVSNVSSGYTLRTSFAELWKRPGCLQFRRGFPRWHNFHPGISPLGVLYHWRGSHYVSRDVSSRRNPVEALHDVYLRLWLSIAY